MRPDETLTLILHQPPFKVSNLSSLFRSLQAAVRETAAAGEPVESSVFVSTGPVSCVGRYRAQTKGDLTLTVWFADRHDKPLEDRSRETFGRAMAEMESTILRGSQHTFWGSAGVSVGVARRGFSNVALHSCAALFSLCDHLIRRSNDCA